jgi:glycosyltransferase involved in cell wall biosynthesis
MQILDDQNFDAIILHGHYYHMTLWQAIHWCKKHGRPYLVRNDANASKEKSALRRFLYKTAFSRNLKSAAGMLIIGRQNRRYFELYGARESQFFMAPWEFDYPQLEAVLEEARPQRESIRVGMGLKSNEVVAICVARLLAVKDIELAVEAIRRVAQKGAPMRLLVVGDGPHRAAIERQIVATNAPATLCGNMDRAGVIQAMVAADIFVLASKFEAWALVVNEACLCGLPLVLSDQVGAGADLLVPGENGFVFPAGDIDALAGYRDALRYAFSGRRQCNAQSTKEDGL